MCAPPPPRTHFLAVLPPQEAFHSVARVVASSMMPFDAFHACPHDVAAARQLVLGQHMFGTAVLHAFLTCNGHLPPHAPVTGIELLTDMLKVRALSIRAATSPRA